MAQQEPTWRIFRYIGFLTQLGLSVVAPIVLCVLLANYACGRFGIGEWLIALGLGIGLVSGGCGFYRGVRSFLAMSADKPHVAQEEEKHEN